jgi:hypothetical protein
MLRTDFAELLVAKVQCSSWGVWVTVASSGVGDGVYPAGRLRTLMGFKPGTHILALLINSTEAGNLLRGNDALHAMLDASTRARMQLVLVTMMFICLIARLLI